MSAADHFDVVVVGAGPSGCVAAVTLARQGYSILLAESGRPRHQPAEVLAPDVVRRLRSVLPTLSASGGEAVTMCRGVVSQWGRAPIHMTDYELLSLGPAWIVRRPAFDGLLWSATEDAGVTFAVGWRLTSVAERGDHRLVSFSTPYGQRQRAAAAVVNATGRAAQPAGSRREYLDRQVAISTVLKALDPHDLLYVESDEAGWWYMNALPGGGGQLVRVTVYADTMRTAASRVAGMRSAFAELSLLPRHCVQPRFEDARVTDARLSRFAGVLPAAQWCSGDAAETTDPLSGQGWHRAIVSGEQIAAQVHVYLCGVRSESPSITRRPRVSFTAHAEGRRRQWAAAGILGAVG